MKEIKHIPVLLNEILYWLNPQKGGYFLDGTIGEGGHGVEILNRISKNGFLWGIDADENVLEITNKRLVKIGNNYKLINENFRNLKSISESYNIYNLNGILLDLGMSSYQLTQQDRGFSFQVDSPLDMRFSKYQKLTAYDIINTFEEKELSDIIWKYGEEKYSRKIANMIVKIRKKNPIKTTHNLRSIILQVIPKRNKGIDPATRTFQALRIATNDELNSLKSVLPTAINILKPGGRLAVISFHSLEDRIVKKFFQDESRDCLCPVKQPICNCNHKASIKILTPKVIIPSEDEIKNNPHSRSAKLRVVEKLKKKE